MEELVNDAGNISFALLIVLPLAIAGLGFFILSAGSNIAKAIREKKKGND